MVNHNSQAYLNTLELGTQYTSMELGRRAEANSSEMNSRISKIDGGGSGDGVVLDGLTPYIVSRGYFHDLYIEDVVDGFKCVCGDASEVYANRFHGIGVLTQSGDYAFKMEGAYNSAHECFAVLTQGFGYYSGGWGCSVRDFATDGIVSIVGQENSSTKLRLKTYMRTAPDDTVLGRHGLTGTSRRARNQRERLCRTSHSARAHCRRTNASMAQHRRLKTLSHRARERSGQEGGTHMTRTVEGGHKAACPGCRHPIKHRESVGVVDDGKNIGTLTATARRMESALP